MKVLFIYTDIGISVSYSCGIGVLSAYLKRNGHQTTLLHVTDELNYPLDVNRLVKDVLEYKPGLICFSCVTNQWFYVKTIAKFIRRACNIPICVGGHHANAASREIIKEPAVDFVCKGEGEVPLVELVRRLEAREALWNIPNMLTRRDSGSAQESNRHVHASAAAPQSSSEDLTIIDSERKPYKEYFLEDGTQVIDNSVGRWIDKLDTLPFEDREVFDYQRIVENSHGWAEVIASRGCPYACTYCFNIPFVDMYKRDLAGTPEQVKSKDYIRRRSVETTVEMLKEIKDKYSNVQFFTFVDDVFAIYSRWLADLAPAYRDVVGLPFSATSQPLAFNEKIAALLQLMGCTVLKMGVEAGNPAIRNKVLNRNIPDKVLIEDFTLARRYGLKPQAFNMIGIPTETKEDMLQTARLNAQLRSYVVGVSTFMPYPGTGLDDFCRENDLVDHSRWDQVKSYSGGSVLKEVTFTHADLERVRVMFRWYLNASLANECSDEYQNNIDELTSLSDDIWLSGDAEKIWQEREPELDAKYRRQSIDHYIGRKYNNMFWAKEYGYDLF